MSGCAAVVAVLAMALCGVAAPSALAHGLPFQRGDVFLIENGGVQEYSPAGALQQTIPGTSAATLLCFDPSGKHLILPGVGLFDNSGNPLPSSWASVTNADHCVADGLGNVYVSTGSVAGGDWAITKYTLTGHLLQTFSVAPYSGVGGLAIALGPDECTMYYAAWDSQSATETEGHGGTGALNVCTNTEESPVIPYSFTDDLAILPNWQVILTDDPVAKLFDATGVFVQNYIPTDPAVSNNLRFVSLDPDGTSFWVSTAGTLDVLRFDISSGHQISEWPGGGPMAVYGPPLAGNADVERNRDDNPAGTAEAFPTRAQHSGQMTHLRVYVDASSTAAQIDVGIYSDRRGHPGRLQGQASIPSPRAGSWNDVSLPSPITVTAGQRLWTAILGPSGAGRIRFRDDAHSARGSETSAQRHLTALPATWSGGTGWATGNLSAFGG
jgi:hypothetical protein